jgi:hypothetical protein
MADSAGPRPPRSRFTFRSDQRGAGEPRMFSFCPPHTLLGVRQKEPPRRGAHQKCRRAGISGHVAVALHDSFL